MDQTDLIEFERLAYGQQHESAARYLLDLLDSIDRAYGSIWPSDDPPAGMTGDGFLIRLASAISAVFAHPDLLLSDRGFVRLVTANRWISAIFNATPFRNTDHLLRTLTGNDGRIAAKNLPRFAALYTQESHFEFPIDRLHAVNPLLAVSMALGLLNSRQMISSTAHQKREAILQWLPEKLDRLEGLDGLPLTLLPNAAMNCSYADGAYKHEIKRSINALIQRDLERRGIAMPKSPERGPGRPVMLVVLDWWKHDHAMYRCYSPLLIAAQKDFKLVALVTNALTADANALSVFDETISLASNVPDWSAELKRILPLIAAIVPVVVYYPAIGMSQAGLFLSNLRLAPLQIATLGHPATPAATCIDYVLNAPEFHGSEGAFHEKLVLMPAGTQSFLLPPDAPPPPRGARKIGRTVRIAIVASAMKLNPGLLDACRMIAGEASHDIEFNFFVAGAVGLTYSNVMRAVTEVLPDAVVHPERPYSSFVQELARCDMFLSPFPFGNTNGLVDCVRLGLPGVCLHGDEPHASIDRGLFRIAGLPEDLIATTRKEYVTAAAALVGNPERRLLLRRQLLAANLDKRFASGRPEGFVETVRELLARQRGGAA